MVNKSNLPPSHALAWQEPVLQSCGHTTEAEAFHESVMRSSAKGALNCETCKEPIAPWAPTNELLVDSEKPQTTARKQDTSRYPDGGIAIVPDCYERPDVTSRPEELRRAEESMTRLLSTPPVQNHVQRTTILGYRGRVRYALGNKEGFYSDIKSAVRLDPRRGALLPAEQADFEAFDSTYKNNLAIGPTERPVSDEELQYATLDPLTYNAITDPVTFACGHTFDEGTVQQLSNANRKNLQCPIDRLVTPWFLRNVTAAEMSATLGTRSAGEPKEVLHVFAPLPLNLLLNQEKEIKEAFAAEDYNTVLRLDPRHTEARSLRAEKQSAAFRQRVAAFAQLPEEERKAEKPKLEAAGRGIFNEWYDCLLARPNDAAFKKNASEFATDPRDFARLANLCPTQGKNAFLDELNFCRKWLDHVKANNLPIQSEKDAEMLLWAMRFKALRLAARYPEDREAARDKYRHISECVIPDDLWRALPWTQAQRADFIQLQGSACANPKRAAELFELTPVDLPAARAHVEYAEALAIQAKLDVAPAGSQEQARLKHDVVEALRLTLEQALQTPRTPYAKGDLLGVKSAEQLADALWELHSEHTFVVEQLAALYAQVGEAMPSALKVLLVRSFYKLDDDVRASMRDVEGVIGNNQDDWLADAAVAPNFWVRSMLHEIDAMLSDNIALEYAHRTAATLLRRIGGYRPLA